MKVTSNGMERRGTPSGPSHHAHSTPKAIPPAYEAAKTSWWAQPTDALFAEALEQNRERMARVSFSLPTKEL